MTTWTLVEDEATSYTAPADQENNYMAAGYVVNGYIDGAGIWVRVDSADSAWSAA